jgi:cold shock CspA family protein
MRKGMVLRIDQSNGFGLIQDENEQEIAFCLKNTDKNIKISDSVEFEIQLTQHGLTAINLNLLILI